MRLTKSTRYALHSMLDLAAADGRPVTVGQVAARWGIPESALAKVMQQLVRVGLVRGVRGIGGGYVLARPAAGVTVQDVLDVFEAGAAPADPWPGRSPGRRPDGVIPPPGAAPPSAVLDRSASRLRALFEEVDQTARATFRSVTLDTLAR